jgi:hypothetical protein
MIEPWCSKGTDIQQGDWQHLIRQANELNYERHNPAIRQIPVQRHRLCALWSFAITCLRTGLYCRADLDAFLSPASRLPCLEELGLEETTWIMKYSERSIIPYGIRTTTDRSKRVRSTYSTLGTPLMKYLGPLEGINLKL